MNFRNATRISTRICTVAILSLLLWVLLTATHAADGPAPPIKIVHHPIGRLFTNKEGMTLYTYAKDGGHSSTCLEDCLELWTPLYAKEGAKGMGLFSVFKRKDGPWQWAYKRRPLYTWKEDRRPGDIRGHGYKGRFHIAQP